MLIVVKLLINVFQLIFLTFCKVLKHIFMHKKIKGVIHLQISNLLKAKRTFVLALSTTFLLSVSMASVEPIRAFAAENTTNNAAESRTINVSGNGEVNATPDIAYITLGVITEKTTVSEAQSANTAAMNSIIDAIKKAGIASEDIKTSNYNISPKYNYEDKTGNSTVVAYTVSNTLKVTVKDISKAGSIIDLAVENGANISNGISFGVSDYEKYYNMALADAIKNAKDKAEVIANAINVSLSSPVKIVENSSGVQNENTVYFNASMKAANAAGAGGTSVESGTYKIKANVSLVYEY